MPEFNISAERQIMIDSLVEKAPVLQKVSSDFSNGACKKNREKPSDSF